MVKTFELNEIAAVPLITLQLPKGYVTIVQAAKALLRQSLNILLPTEMCANKSQTTVL